MHNQPLIQQILQGMQRFQCPSDYWLSKEVEFQELEDAHSTIHRNGQSVWEHTMLVIDILQIKNPITLLSGLFHDLGKSYVSQVNNQSSSKFSGHDFISSGIAKNKLAEWGASSYLSDRIIRIVAGHMYDMKNATNEKTIRKFVANVGVDNIDNWFALRIADSRSYAAQQEYYTKMIQPFKVAVESYFKKQPSTNRPELPNIDRFGSIQIKGEIVSES